MACQVAQVTSSIDLPSARNKAFDGRERRGRRGGRSGRRGWVGSPTLCQSMIVYFSFFQVATVQTLKEIRVWMSEQIPLTTFFGEKVLDIYEELIKDDRDYLKTSPNSLASFV
jgi:hypothetical protein